MAAFGLLPLAKECAATGRTFRPGERYVSVLLNDGPNVVRRDYAADAAVPADSLARWSGTVPPGGAAAPVKISDEALLDCFRQLDGSAEAGRQNVRYVLALLLLRRKRLRFEDVEKANGAERLILRDPKTGDRHAVPDPKLSGDDLERVQTEVTQSLGWE